MITKFAETPILRSAGMSPARKKSIGLSKQPKKFKGISHAQCRFALVGLMMLVLPTNSIVYHDAIKFGHEGPCETLAQAAAMDNGDESYIAIGGVTKSRAMVFDHPACLETAVPYVAVFNSWD